MGAITDLWKSERGLLAVLLVVGATILTGLGHMTVAEWRDYTLLIFGMYAGLKTVTGVVDRVVDAKKAALTEPTITIPTAPPTSSVTVVNPVFFEPKKDPA